MGAGWKRAIAAARATAKPSGRLKTPAMGIPSVLEETLWLHLRAAGIQSRFKREFRAIAARKWRWDFAEPNQMLLIECEGKIWHRGGHTTGTGITRDIEKGNAATLVGYRTLRFTREMIESGLALTQILEMLGLGKRYLDGGL